MASPVAEHRLRMRRLRGHGSRAQLLCGMWDLPGPGHEPLSPRIGRRTLNHCATRQAHQESFCSYISRKNLVGFLSVLLLGTAWSTSHCRRPAESDSSDCCFDFVNYGNHTHFAFGSGVPTPGPFYTRIQLFALRLSFSRRWLQFPL